MEKFEHTPVPLDLHSESFEAQIRAEGSMYARKAESVANARRVEEVEIIQTFMSDGTLESTREANPGDWIITGPDGEQFVLTDEKVHDLYEQTPDGSLVAKERKIIAFKNPTNAKIRIPAPWATLEKPVYQDGEKDCMLAIGLTADGELSDDRYIIGNENILVNNYNLVA